MRLLVALAALTVLDGCSLIAARRVPGMSERCMPSQGYPIADTAVVVAAAALDVVAFTCNDGAAGRDGGPGPCLVPRLFAAGFSIAALPALISALDGFSRDRCPSEIQLSG